MLKTANQRIAALVLAGGAISLVALLLLAYTLPQRHPNLVETWFTANFISVFALTQGAFYDIPTILERYSAASMATMTAFILSYGLGLWLAVRVLREGWRSVRRRAFFTRNRLSAALVWVGGVIAVAGMAWFWSACAQYMSFCELSLPASLPLAWMELQYLFLSPLTDIFDPPPPYYDQTLSHKAYLTITALAISYLFGLALAVATLQRRVRAWARLARQINRERDREEDDHRAR